MYLDGQLGTCILPIPGVSPVDAAAVVGLDSYR